MDNSSSPESIQDRSMLPMSNYLNDSWNVRARFFLYELARDSKDIEALAYSGSNTEPSHSLLDVGAADGAFFERLALEFLHSGDMFAIDKNPEQFLRKNYPTFTDEQILKGIRGIKILEALLRNTTIELPEIELDNNPDQNDFLYRWSEGDVSDLKFPENSFDRVFALFMLYHVPDSERDGALREIKRVLKDDGVFVMATSGENNKAKHREYEAEIAANLGVEAPVLMNQGFTTEKAVEVLQGHFKYMFVLSQETDMVIKTDSEIDAYIASQMSLYNQYTPIPSEEQFEREMIRLEQEIRNIIERDDEFEDERDDEFEDERGGEFVDHISRSILLGTDDPNFAPSEPGFVLLESKYIELNNKE